MWQSPVRVRAYNTRCAQLIVGRRWNPSTNNYLWLFHGKWKEPVYKHSPPFAFPPPPPASSSQGVTEVKRKQKLQAYENEANSIIIEVSGAWRYYSNLSVSRDYRRGFLHSWQFRFLCDPPQVGCWQANQCQAETRKVGGGWMGGGGSPLFLHCRQF